MATKHAWDLSGSSGMKIEDDSLPLYNMPAVLDHMEAERLVEGLRKFSIEEVGSSAWMEQHRSLEKLNIQAHHSAMTNSDEFVLEAILTFQKLELLIEDLIVIEAWKEFVYPHLLQSLAGRNSMRLYFILYHEATLVNLFEVLFYHKHVVASGGEKLLEIVDYAARKLARLNSGYSFREYSPDISSGVDASAAKKWAEDLAQRSPQEDLALHFTQIEFRVCISAVSIARLLCEHVDAMPLSVVSRISDTHDYLVLIVPLIENPPWTRRTDKGKWQKLVEQTWTEVAPIDLLKITKLEGQPWLAVYHLVAKKEFRERYHFNQFRKGQLLRVRKYIHEALLDQLPVLADIQRFMDEIAIVDVPEPHNFGSAMMFQQVALIRDSILKNKDWKNVAEHQRENIFTMTDKNDVDLRKLADLYADDLATDVMEPVVKSGDEDYH